MTLILSLATGQMVLHVGDRLLTKDGSAWDPLANKSVIVLGSDGWACVSYSGLAYIGSKPTDQWLAEILSDREAGPGGRGMMFGGNLVPRVGPALARPRSAIEGEFTQQPHRHRALGMHIEMSGFTFRRRRTPCPRGRPFIRRYSHRGLDNGQLEQMDSPRYWNWDTQIQVGHVGQDPGDTKRLALGALGSASNKNQDDCERILVECIRAVSRDNDAVGANCMSIVLSRYGDVRVRFLPDPANDSGQTSYTPWIVAPGAMVPPMILGGGLPHIQAGPFRIDFDRLPPLGSSLPLTASSQPRNPFP